MTEPDFNAEKFIPDYYKTQGSPFRVDFEGNDLNAAEEHGYKKGCAVGFRKSAEACIAKIRGLFNDTLDSTANNCFSLAIQVITEELLPQPAGQGEPDFKKLCDEYVAGVDHSADDSSKPRMMTGGSGRHCGPHEESSSCRDGMLKCRPVDQQKPRRMKGNKLLADRDHAHFEDHLWSPECEINPPCQPVDRKEG